LTPPPPLAQSDALTDSSEQTWTPACSQLLSAAKLSECGQTAASGLLLTGGTSSRLHRSPGPATNSPSPARHVLSSSPAASSAASQPRIAVRQTKKQQVGSCHAALPAAELLPVVCCHGIIHSFLPLLWHVVCLHALHGVCLHAFYTLLHAHIHEYTQSFKTEKASCVLPLVLSCSNVNAGYDGLRGQEACQRHAWRFRCCVTKDCSSAQS